MLQVKDQFGNFKTENFAELRMKAFGATDSGEPKAANGIEQAPARWVCVSLKCLQPPPQAAVMLCRLALTFWDQTGRESPGQHTAPLCDVAVCQVSHLADRSGRGPH